MKKRFPSWDLDGLVSGHRAGRLPDGQPRRERMRGTLPPGWEYALPSEAQWEYACRLAIQPSDRRYNLGLRPALVPSRTEQP